jgi:hypothetical protein
MGTMQLQTVGQPPMPIIVGAPRSGTTLLRFMLDAHSELAIPPETGFLAPIAEEADGMSCNDLHRLVTTYPLNFPGWGDFGIDAETYASRLQQIDLFSVAEGIREFYRLYAAKHGKIRYGDKTPIYCRHMRAIESLLPESHFIHIIRDGRDVAVSLRKVWFAPGQDIATLASYWTGLVRDTRAAAPSVRRYMEVRYEALIEDPESVLQAICAFIHLKFSPKMLHYWEHTPQRLKEHRGRHSSDGSLVVTHERRLEQQRLTMHPPQQTRIYAWRMEMCAADQSEFRRVAGDALDELGYA